jgi:hypothetical protein
MNIFITSIHKSLLVAVGVVLVALWPVSDAGLKITPKG